jgi:ABC-2 type transport system permease protein
LWFTPIDAWLVLISAWAKRSPLLWAVLPPVLICVLEKTTFNTTYFGAFIRYRITGAMDNAFVVLKPGPVSHISSWDILPLRFLSTPGLWGGLIFAALCLAATVRLRRNREPI